MIMVTDTVFLWANEKRLEWAAQGLWVSLERRSSYLPSVAPSLHDSVIIIVSYQDTVWAQATINDTGHIDLTIARHSDSSPSGVLECVYAVRHQVSASEGANEAIDIIDGFFNDFMKNTNL